MNNQGLSAKQEGIVPIAAFTARGDLRKLKTALGDGLDAGLTINEIKEILVKEPELSGISANIACAFASERAWDSGGICARRSANFLAIDQPFLAKLLQVFVIQAIRNRHMRFVPALVTRLVTPDQQDR